MGYTPTAPVLRVCLPDDTTRSGVQQYNIHFRDDAQFKQALSALKSAHISPSSSKRSSLSSLGTSPPPVPPKSSARPAPSNSSGSSTPPVLSSTPPPSTPPSPLTPISLARADALAILEGRKIPIPNRDYGNALWAQIYDYWALCEDIEAQRPRERAPVVPNAHPSALNPLFSFSSLHTILCSGLQENEPQKRFALPTELVEPTLVFLGKGYKEEGQVRSKACLKGKSVAFFEALMLDVMVRGWTDVLWLGRRGEEVPGFVDTEDGAVSLSWGEAMI